MPQFCRIPGQYRQIPAKLPFYLCNKSNGAGAAFKLGYIPLERLRGGEFFLKSLAHHIRSCIDIADKCVYFMGIIVPEFPN